MSLTGLQRHKDRFKAARLERTEFQSIKDMLRAAYKRGGRAAVNNVVAELAEQVEISERELYTLGVSP